MTLSTGLLIHLTETWMQLLVMISSGLLGYIFIQSPARITNDLFPLEITKKSGFILITLFIGLLFGLSILAHMTQYHDLLLINTFYRAGALVFGGGHAVIAFLNTTVVNYHWLDHQTFITGYATVQAMPGPLFSFAGFLGASMNQAPNGFPGGIICLISIFLPGFLIAIGILPFWTVIKDHQAVRSSLAGIHASVVGMLAATLYSHFYLNSVHGLIDLFWIIVTTIALLYLKIKPWMLVIISMILSLLLLR
ncbi:hypothetical protein EBS02_05715 [bacterium]|nr:hypothetical protein [bacterium]